MRPANGRHINWRYGNWPTESQEDLISAAVLGDNRCVEAWGRWSAETKFEDIDYESFRMLPLVYRNLTEFRSDDPNLPRMKGIYRQTWYKNQMLFNALAGVVHLLQEERIEVLVIKGAPISLLFYGREGLRQMHDIDILVKPDEAKRALHILHDSGWKPLSKDALDWSAEGLDVRYATHFRDEADVELDLHWYALKSCRFRSADAELWSRSAPILLNGIESRTFDASGHLLHVCVHGISSHNTSPMRWVADAVTILTAGREIDWGWLEYEIGRRQIRRSMHDAFEYLRSRFAAPIPSSILERLSEPAPRLRETWEFWASTRTTERGLAAIIMLWATYARRAEGNGGKPSFPGFLIFLKLVWQVERIRGIPIRAVRKLMRRSGLPGGLQESAS